VIRLQKRLPLDNLLTQVEPVRDPQFAVTASAVVLCRQAILNYVLPL
jgi:hypothetical protein